jgi:hypothetical protein
MRKKEKHSENQENSSGHPKDENKKEKHGSCCH